MPLLEKPLVYTAVGEILTTAFRYYGDTVTATARFLCLVIPKQIGPDFVAWSVYETVYGMRLYSRVEA